MDILEVKDLTIKFGGVIAVNNVSFTLKEGEALGVIGPNGSGKTTLFNLLSGIYSPTSGEIILNGENVQGLRPDKVFSKGVSRTFQNGRLFWSLSVLENIMFGLETVRTANILAPFLQRNATKQDERAAIKRATEIMGIFGTLLIDQANKLASELSYADRRRLEICRAIASNPKVILLDEPSAGMDNIETEKLMYDLLKVKKMLPNLTMIVVEHDMAFIKGLVNKVLVLNYGENIACGAFDEVAGNEQVIKAYLGQEAG